MNFIQNLKNRLTQTLPGSSAQAEMSPTAQRLKAIAPEEARIACVLALFFPKDGKQHLVLIERANSNPNDRHRGQIGFPGGKLEDSDDSLLAGALREAEEEVGIISSDVEVLGALSELYIPVSNFKVYPFVGYLPYTPKFVAQESEVQSILEIPFELFLKESNRKKKDMTMSNNFTMQNVPYFDIQGQVVWGATSMMLNELIACAKDALAISNSMNA